MPCKADQHMQFIHFKNDDERNKYIRSANMLKKRITRKKLKDNSINGCRRKIPSEKNGARQILHSRKNTTFLSF